MAILTVSGSPHIQSTMTTNKIMWSVVLALMPAWLVGIYFFGLAALYLTVVTVASCVLFEWIIQKYLMKGALTITDGSAVITGLLLAFNLPANTPLWIAIIGSLVAIGVGKMSFGGLGKNVFNPALVGRVFLFLSFPTFIAASQWVMPHPIFDIPSPDAITGATPLAIMKQGGSLPPIWDMIMGDKAGSFGEVSAIALILGGLFLLYRRIITWHSPVAFIGSAVVFTAILWMVNPDKFFNPLYHIFSGGLMLGALFMATDMVTTPVTGKGQIIFGLGCGILTIVFRCFGSMPEGVSFAILIMNACTPLINKFSKPKRFGVPANQTIK
ncbi:MAG: RnfABCDGE type electron transport complex subunit D [Bacteroidales bacterium]|nr:RnfABCDGE type electron transport complex subunit D [Bacteroidales bacterium]